MNINSAFDWFEQTFGFEERRYSYENVRKQFTLEKNETILVSLANGRRFNIGKFDTPSIEQLDALLKSKLPEGGPTFIKVDDSGSGTAGEPVSGSVSVSGLAFQHVIADIRALIRDPQNANAVFQAASQFNCLEMISPQVTPDAGITNYIRDLTQGPMCAIACPGATVYRNYFVNEHGQGGKKGKQIDCLEGVHTTLTSENDDEEFWIMQNGYALPAKSDSMRRLKTKLHTGVLNSRTAMKKLRVGVHWNTEVNNSQQSNQNGHCVTQVYSSAVPISYGLSTCKKNSEFESFAKLVLYGTYQATFSAAAIRAIELNKRVDLYLTKVGGGVFGNRSRWIVDAIKKCLRRFEDFPINVHLVHYGSLEQVYVEYLKGGPEKSLISDYITSNIDVTKLSTSPTSYTSNSFDSKFGTAEKIIRKHNDDRNIPKDTDDDIENDNSQKSIAEKCCEIIASNDNDNDNDNEYISLQDINSAKNELDSLLKKTSTN